jgi:RNA polymerase sigma-70 factor (ECF subfamily)
LSSRRTSFGATAAVTERAPRCATTQGRPATPAEHEVAQRYLRAWSSNDPNGLAELLREDVKLAMPPVPSWYEGKAVVQEFLRQFVFGRGYYLAARAPAVNGSLTVALWRAEYAQGPYEAESLHVLTLDEHGAVAANMVFLGPDAVTSLGLAKRVSAPAG